MSSKAERVLDSRLVERLPWGNEGAGADASRHAPTSDALAGAALAEAERAAFAAGYAKGEAEGAERVKDQLWRIGETVEQLASLRRVILLEAERQLVELAVAIAGRILRQEISTDRTLLLAIARAAITRLGDSAQATVHLHPDDHAAIEAMQKGTQQSIQIVPDPAVQPGGCLVQSTLGTIEASVADQLDELTAMLLDTDTPGVTEGQQSGAHAAA
jgi:flagellar assembly protein FliH